MPIRFAAVPAAMEASGTTTAWAFIESDEAVGATRLVPVRTREGDGELRP